MNLLKQEAPGDSLRYKVSFLPTTQKKDRDEWQTLSKVRAAKALVHTAGCALAKQELLAFHPDEVERRWHRGASWTAMCIL